MILDVHREPFGLRIERRALWHGPRQEDPFPLEAEVVVQMAREVFLDAEEESLLGLCLLGAFCRDLSRSPEGSGVELKLRFCLYFSRTIGTSISNRSHNVSLSVHPAHHSS